MTLNGVQQSAMINSSGAFSTILQHRVLASQRLAYTVSYAYSGDGTFVRSARRARSRSSRQCRPSRGTAPADIDLRHELSSTQLDASASVPGSFTYIAPRGHGASRRRRPDARGPFVPTDSTDYTALRAHTPVNVAKATATITWLNPTEITYGTALSSTQFDATASVPGTFTYNPAAGTQLRAGTDQTLSVSFAPRTPPITPGPWPSRPSTWPRQCPPSSGRIRSISPTARRCPPPSLMRPLQSQAR